MRLKFLLYVRLYILGGDSSTPTPLITWVVLRLFHGPGWRWGRVFRWLVLQMPWATCTRGPLHVPLSSTPDEIISLTAYLTETLQLRRISYFSSTSAYGRARRGQPSPTATERKGRSGHSHRMRPTGTIQNRQHQSPLKLLCPPSGLPRFHSSLSLFPFLLFCLSSFSFLFFLPKPGRDLGGSGPFLRRQISRRIAPEQLAFCPLRSPRGTHLPHHGLCCGSDRQGPHHTSHSEAGPLPGGPWRRRWPRCSRR